MLQQSKKIKPLRFLEWLIKLSIAAGAIWFIYKRVLEKGSVEELFQSYSILFKDSTAVALIIAVLLLMLFNWSLEAIKWKLMISKIEQVGFFRALEAVFSGLTVGFFTPNRAGEFAGRIFHLRSSDRIKGSLITIIENSSQLVMTIFTGSVALIFYFAFYLPINSYWLMAGAVASGAIGIAAIFFFLNIYLLENFFDHFKLLKKYHPYIEVFSYYRTAELLKVLGLALVRFFVFTLQFYFLLCLFDSPLPLLPAAMMISLTFYVMTLVPTFFLTELAVRGSVAIAFLSSLTDNEDAILHSTISLWLINIVLPALIGALFVFAFRFRKDKAAI